MIGRASGTLTFPANFMFVAAMNKCLCDWFGDDRHECTFSPVFVKRYQQRISGPLMGRIDIRADIKRVPFEELSGLAPGDGWSSLGAIADLAGTGEIQMAHLAEAIQCRSRSEV